MHMYYCYYQELLLLSCFFSWSVNVLDGVLLITVHLLQYTNVAIGNKLYTVLYDPKYIYVVWSIEVRMKISCFFCKLML